jgi:hypothetical protein
LKPPSKKTSLRFQTIPQNRSKSKQEWSGRRGYITIGKPNTEFIDLEQHVLKGTEPAFGFPKMIYTHHDNNS